MPLAIFDLDHTLIGGDSDHLWGQYLCTLGAVDPEVFSREHDRYYADYLAGRLDIDAFLRFQLAPLARHPRETLERWRGRFLEEHIRPILLPKADELIAGHRARGDHPLIITATNRFITEPIAGLLGIDDLIATEPEEVDGAFTGRVAGVPSFAEGKVHRLQAWLEEHAMDLAGSWFYSDSRNDLPLLERVDHPVAVDPDPALEAAARERGWPVMSLR